MRAFDLFSYALTVGAAAMLLSACDGATVPAGPSDRLPQRQMPRDSVKASVLNAGGHFKPIFSFDGADGWSPNELSYLDGAFYGTTLLGGSGSCTLGGEQPGCGVIYILTPSGSENILYNFQGGTDGAFPTANLLQVRGALYGTTEGGGALSYCGDTNIYGCGTVFSVTSSGVEKVLYAFKGSPDGAFPGTLTQLHGVLYGITSMGGAHGFGTVFSMRKSGIEKPLYSFKGSSDGAYPTSLIVIKGLLYGTTAFGGSGCESSPPRGCGTIFRITTSGKERVIYRFGGADASPPDGQWPNGIVAVDRVFYGTTRYGGTSHRCSRGCGTTFSATTSGAERILHSFQGRDDGANPQAGLRYMNKMLYGTTYSGGINEGLLFSQSVNGNERVLHRFRKGTGLVQSTLTAVDGVLYGTGQGGRYKNPNGLVFSFAP